MSDQANYPLEKGRYRMYPVSRNADGECEMNVSLDGTHVTEIGADMFGIYWLADPDNPASWEWYADILTKEAAHLVFDVLTDEPDLAL